MYDVLEVLQEALTQHNRDLERASCEEAEMSLK